LTAAPTWGDVSSIANAGDSYKPTAAAHV
jgi:hypothetical protein